MKKTFLLALLGAIALSQLAAGDALAQQPRPGAPNTVAILDLTYIFKHHVRFKQMSEDMKRDVDAAESALKADRDSYQKLIQKLEDYKRGSPEYKQLEEEIAKRGSELNLRVNIQKKDFLEQESRIYYTVYQEILECVRRHSEQYGISLVLRFNGDPIDRNDPQEILKELNKSVIYYNQAIDITPVILDMTARMAPNPGGMRQPTAPAQGIPPAAGIPPGARR